MKRYTLVKMGEPGEKCYKHLDRQSNRYRDNKHPQKAIVNVCEQCAQEDV